MTRKELAKEFQKLMPLVAFSQDQCSAQLADLWRDFPEQTMRVISTIFARIRSTDPDDFGKIDDKAAMMFAAVGVSHVLQDLNGKIQHEVETA